MRLLRLILLRLTFPLILVKSEDAVGSLVTRRNVYTDLEGISAGEGIDSNATISLQSC